jgi:hypothetical protein
VFAAIFSVVLPITAAEDGLGIPSRRSGLRVVVMGETALVLEFELPGLEAGIGIVNGKKCREVSVAGLVNAGEPPLPVSGTLIGIPPGSIPSATLLELETTKVPSAIGVCPPARPLPGFDATTPGLLRSQEVAAVRIKAVQYDSSTQDLYVHTRLRVRVDFKSDRRNDARCDGCVEDEGPFEEILRSSLLNYDQARQWRVGPRSTATSYDVKSGTPPGAFKFLVNRDGLYRLRHTGGQRGPADLQTVQPRVRGRHPDSGRGRRLLRPGRPAALLR